MQTVRLWSRGLTPRGRLTFRWTAAGLSLACAVVYTLIGTGTIQVVTGDQAGLDAFGSLSAAAFAFGAALLFITDRRPFWALGACFQVFAIAMYFAVAPQRTPSYEVWGLGLKVLQAAILVLLVALALPARGTTAPRRR